MKDDLLKYKIGVSLLDNVGDITAKKLIAYCGGPEGVFKESKKALLKIPSIGEKVADSILNSSVLDEAEKEIEFIAKNKIQPFFFLDEAYPQRLNQYDDSPLLLYSQGACDWNSRKIISIVGTRQATDYGKDFLKDFIKELTPHQPLIVSGLAYGIDYHAHSAALKNELPTAGVLGHGLDRIYPAVHEKTAKKMLANGGLLTEFPSGTNPDKQNFPKRNRIVAGICDALLVVESGYKGGSMITARIANSYGKDVFALPGKITDEFSAGTNHLIKTHQSAMLESVKDLEYIMQWNAASKKDKPKVNTDALSNKEAMLVEHLERNGKVGIDEICVKADLQQAEVAGLLLNLEFSGVVKSLPGKEYMLN